MRIATTASIRARPGCTPRPGAYAAALPVGAYINVARVAATDVLTGATILDDDTANYVITSPTPAAGRMTGGGSIYTEDGMRVTHGFELHCDIDIGPTTSRSTSTGTASTSRS